MRKVKPDELAEFLSTPRKMTEVASWLKAPTVTPVQVWNLTLPDDWSMFEQKDSTGLPVFAAAKQEFQGPPFRAYNIWKDPSGDPYVWIQFPRELHLSRVRIVPLSDVHYGAKAHNKKRFVKYLKWIEEQDDVYTFLNGDIIENALGDSVGGAVYESLLTPDEQLWGAKKKNEEGIIELLRPIAHKIMWAQPGNHEWRSWKHANIDPTKIICRELDIPYFSEPVYADILSWGQKFTFYCHHGVSGSNTKGGKMNAAGKPAEFQEAVDFVIMGHVHDSMVNMQTRLVRTREFDSKGKLTSFKLEERPQYVVICPSFHGYFQSYGSRAGYAPGSWGSVSCTLFKDGNYLASE